MTCECPKKPSGAKFPANFTLTPGTQQYPNPGSVENLHKRFRKILPEFFDGIEFTYRNSFAPNKTLKTNWTFSHNRPSGFRIGGVYYWSCHKDCLRTPKIEAYINPSTLASNLSVLYYPLPYLKLKTNIQRSTEEAEANFKLEYDRRWSTISLNVYNPSLDRGRCTFSVLRSLSDEFAIGSELLVEWEKDGLMADTAFAARLNKNQYSIAATASRQGMDISYCRQISSSIQMGSSLAYNKNTKKAIAIIGYQWAFEKATVRGMLDSDWSVGFMYNKFLKDIPCSMGLCVLLCLPINRFTFGLKFNLDPGLKCS